MSVGRGDANGRPAVAKADFGAVPRPRKLSTKMLGLTILFVLIAEVLIFIPSIANFRLRWLEERLATAAAASVVLVQGDTGELSPGLRNDVLMALGAKAIAVRNDGVSRLLVVSDMPPQVDEHIQPMRVEPLAAMLGALDTLVAGGDRMLRVFGRVGQSDMEFELIIPDEGLRNAMLVYARNVAILSLLISLITAGLVFFAIHATMIRPIRDLRNSMVAFADAPDDPTRVLRPSGRRDEIGVAEQGLSVMQAELQRTLGEQKHLADLGLAVSKINHDMRNILASAQLMSDRLQSVDDPSVQMIAPKLLRAIDRAVSYTEGVLAYGRAQEPPPARRVVRLSRLVDDVFSMLGLDTGSAIECINAVAPDMEVDADSEQLFRILTNLARNAVQAMSTDMDGAVVRRLTVSADREGSVSRIFVEDTGPGLPTVARENLFAAFRGSARSGGTGLGLAIAHELVRAHGGTIDLVESVGGRTVFAMTIPDQPVLFDVVRSVLRRPA